MSSDGGIPNCSVVGLISFAPSFVLFLVPWAYMLTRVPAKRGIAWRERALFHSTSSPTSRPSPRPQDRCSHAAPFAGCCQSVCFARTRACLARLPVMHKYIFSVQTTGAKSTGQHHPESHGKAMDDTADASLPNLGAVEYSSRCYLRSCHACRAFSTLPLRTCQKTPYGPRCSLVSQTRINDHPTTKAQCCSPSSHHMCLERTPSFSLPLVSRLPPPPPHLVPPCRTK